MRGLMLVLLVSLSFAPVNAQDRLTEVRSYIDGAARISTFNLEVVGLMSAAHQADNITAAYQQGQIDPARAAERPLEWRDQMDAELLRLRSAREELSIGPSEYPEANEQSVAGLITNVASTMESIVEFLAMSEAAPHRAREEVLGQASLRYRATRAQLMAQPNATDEEQRILGVVQRLVDNYPLCFEVELRGSAIQATGPDRLDGADAETIEGVLNEIGISVSEREALQVFRTDLAGQL